jgi:hypothetical protein
VAVCNEECMHGSKGSLDDIRHWVVVVILRVGQTRRGGYKKNQWPDGRVTNWSGGTSLRMRGAADGASAGGGGSNNAIAMKNPRRQ